MSLRGFTFAVLLATALLVITIIPFGDEHKLDSHDIRGLTVNETDAADNYTKVPTRHPTPCAPTEQPTYSPSSAQVMSTVWLENDPNRSLYSLQRQWQRRALAMLYYATDGPNSWKETTDWLSYEVSECDWFTTGTAVTVCDEDGNYTSLHLSNNGLNGTLPQHDIFQSLTGLLELDLSQNHLGGCLPHTLVNLKNLESLSLSHNSFQGPANYLPTGSSHYPYSGNPGPLRFLDLSHNNLTDGIWGFFNADGWLDSKLAWLDLSHNQFYGGIPSFLHRLSSLETLCLGSNHLSWEVPLDPDHPLRNLTLLDVSNNDMGGSIPSALHYHTALEVVMLASNQFTGNLSQVVFPNLTRLQHLDVSDNRFTGPLPQDLPSSLLELSLPRNQLEGEIPSTYGKLGNLIRFNAGRNKLQGTVPWRQWGDLKRLQELKLHKNRLTGTLPSELGTQLLPQLKHLNLQLNLGMGGSLPSQMGLSTRLSDLILNGNSITSSIPTELVNAKTLQQILLEDNQLSGPIPSELGLLTGLDDPEVMSPRRGLELLWLANNPDITGTIPAELAGLVPSLKSFTFSGTSLVGDIPQEFCSTPGLSLECSTDVCGCDCVCTDSQVSTSRNGG